MSRSYRDLTCVSCGFLIHVSSMADAEDMEDFAFYGIDDAVIPRAMGAHSFQLSS